ncbi:Ribonuclease H-like superfamily [Sesbania bispinosa]|nr:Ribonuclease H-like superfamily [Sesbania bispinosa]
MLLFINLYGDVFRNHHGNFLLAFAHNLPFVSILEPELLAVLKGLELAWTRMYTKISVEIDLAATLRLIQFECKDTHALFDTVRRIQRLVNLDWLVRFDYVFREVNQSDDLLAAHCLSHHSDAILFYEIPYFLSLSLKVDAAGTWFNRTS